jgi:hypothetical protein
LHLVAYVGDADGNGSYTSNDAILITRVAVQTDAGFAAYPLVDPVIVADTDGVGFIPADAPLQVNEAGVGFPTANLPSPPIPSGVSFQVVPENATSPARRPAPVATGSVVPSSAGPRHPARPSRSHPTLFAETGQAAILDPALLDVVFAENAM